MCKAFLDRARRGNFVGRVVVVGFVCLTLRDALAASPVIHWRNDSSTWVDTALTNTGTFTTTFRAPNDVTVTLLSGSTAAPYNATYGGATPGNNPAYLTTFVGSSSNGTGDGAVGHMQLFQTTGSASGSVQFDFAQPLTAASRLLFSDVDSTEQYQLQGYTLVGATYTPVSLAGWTHELFSGSTGVAPDSRWPTWDGVAGTLTATSSALAEDLSVLRVDQPIARLIISKTGGAGASTGFQVVEVPEPASLSALLLPALLAVRQRRRVRLV
jgi:hypothetical protein